MTEKIKTRPTAATLVLGLSLSFGLALIPVLAQAQDATRQPAERMEQQNQGTEKELGTAKAAAGEDESLVKWHLAGYAHTNFSASSSADQPSSFSGAAFSPVFHFQYSDFILFEAEPELSVTEDGETELELEYAQINLLLHDSVTLVTGKYLSPVGQFRERLHPSWVNKLPNAPAGFGHGGIQPLSEVGIQVRGGVPIAGMTATYAVSVGNGPRVGHHGFETEGFGRDDDSNKAVSGRIGFLPVPYLEVGGSFMTAEATVIEGPGNVTDGDLLLWGFDVAYTRGAWDVRAEYVNAELDAFWSLAEETDPSTSLIPTTNWQAWYVQVAYQLSGLTNMRVLRNLEPVVRYGEFTGEGFEEFIEGQEKRLNVGVNYLFAPSVIAKGSVEFRDLKGAGVEDETRFLLQLAYGF